MAYIYLEELKKILPEIFGEWIDEDDESWEWIFQEIEQKCHFGKRLKGKKWKKKLQSIVDTHSTVLSAHRNDINELNKKIDELNEEAERVHKDLSDIKRITLKDLSNRIEQVRSMAEIAKQRTEVDYSKYSSKSDGVKMCQTCKYSNNIDGFPKSFDIPPCDSCNYNNNWEAKENE